ncbi:hypothetical protein ABKN59_002310 [Abortiporus biennis]
MVENDKDELTIPLRIGAGSFATVYVVGGGSVAFKQVSQPTNANVLRAEYHTLNDIRSRCATDSFFAVPRGFAFNNPLAPNGDFVTSGNPSFSRHRQTTPFITQEDISIFNAPTYAMDRVPALPYATQMFLRKLHFPPSISTKTGPALCRLYFGKNFTGAPPSRFFNTQNFPLDEFRYRQLISKYPYLPSPEKVAAGMGEMLSRVHIITGLDARDVEFVLGGDGFSGFSFYMIDFNQVRKWSKTVEGVDELVSAFFTNDPYYPRPRPNEPLYEAFKSAYMGEYRSDMRGEAFITAIEAEQANRDDATRTTMR